MSELKLKDIYKILVLDDTKADRDLFKFVLSKAGFEVDCASDGQEALTKLANGDFDLVLSDYLMPVMDGYEFLLRLRTDSKLLHVIVIMITSDESDETKHKLLKAGANDFVHKGDSHGEILARIRVHLSAQSAHANRKVLEMAGEMADSINQPLASLIAGVDVLKEKIQKQMSGDQKSEFLDIIKTINKQADLVIDVSQKLKKLGMDSRKHYTIDKR